MAHKEQVSCCNGEREICNTYIFRTPFWLPSQKIRVIRGDKAHSIIKEVNKPGKKGGEMNHVSIIQRDVPLPVEDLPC